jgi:tripartite-type tricarboxylate transporter receptor subunit TctC
MLRFPFAAALGALILLLSPAMAAAQPKDKPIRMIVGFPPGQATELIARVLADSLGRELQQPVIVENKPGQGGSIALGMLASSPADGSVITVSALAAYAINPHLYKSVPYDVQKDLAPVALVADIPVVLVASPETGFKNFGEFVAFAKAHPGQLKHSSSGNGTVSHLGMQDLKQRVGLDMPHVPYQGSSRAMADLAGGHVQVGLDSVAATKALIDSKRLIALAAASRTRLAAFPDLPTLSELGYPGFEVVAWTAVSVPSATPGDVRERLSTVITRIVKSPEFAARLEPLGATPRPGTMDEFLVFLRAESERWKAAVVASGAKVE